MNHPIRQDCFSRYLLVGVLIFSVGYVQYRFLYSALKGPYRAAAAWSLHFILGTFWSHALHRGLTFRHIQKLPYRISLMRTGGAYAGLLVVSTFLMMLLCDRLGCSPAAGWMGTNTTVSLVNFWVMRRYSICTGQGRSA